MEQQTTKISVGILVFKEDNILFGRGKDKAGNIKYILPVGHLEFVKDPIFQTLFLSTF